MTRFQPDLIHQLNSEVHIWQHDPASIITPIQIERCEAVLSAEERERLGQFYHQRDQHTFLVSHAMLRCTLSAYIDKDPAEWLYEKNKYGRPEIMPEQNTCGLRFNLTHTQGYVACIVSKLTDCGVDAEWIDRNTDVEAIAQSVFSTSEQLDIQRQSVEDKKQRFYQYWALKEAYVKAMGKGLSYPLDKFAIQFGTNKDISVRTSPECPTDASWQFYSATLSSKHVIAAAIKHESSHRRVDFVCKQHSCL